MESITNLVTTGCFLVGQAVAAAATIVIDSEEAEMSNVGLGQGVPGGQQGRLGGQGTWHALVLTFTSNNFLAFTNNTLLILAYLLNVEMNVYSTRDCQQNPVSGWFVKVSP
jgi:hypothetical protein